MTIYYILYIILLSENNVAIAKGVRNLSFTCDLENFGERMKGIRKSKGITQAEVVSGVKGAPSYVTRWERGAVYPALESFVQVCLKLDKTPNEMLGVHSDDEITVKDGTEEYNLVKTFMELPSESKAFILQTIAREAEYKLIKRFSHLNQASEPSENK